MPLTDIFGRMPLEKIWVNRAERQRREVDLEAGGFLASIAQRGVINAVILEQVPDSRGYHVLYAGERRYAASLFLGLPDIPFRFAHNPSDTEMQIIELEENLKRKDLTWQETCQAVVRIHALFKEENPSHTFEATGAALGWHDASHVAKYHFINESWYDEAVRGCGTANEAYNLLQRRFARAKANKLEEWLGGGAGGGEEEKENDIRPSNSVNDNYRNGIIGDDSNNNHGQTGRNFAGLAGTQGAPSTTSALPVTQGDFLTWAPSYSGPKFNLIHCDFPFGIKFGESTHKSGSNALHREEGELYQDGSEVYEALLECLVTHFDHFASESCHLMFWYSSRHEIEVATRKALARISGLSFFRFPLLWHKSDNAGFITPGHPRHIYETCLLGVRGDRPIVRYVSDAYSAPSDNSLHMSAKPEPMLRYFMGMLVDEHSRVFDPTCGAGSALRAAEALRAERVFGLEKSPEMVNVANAEALRVRALRKMTEGK